MDIRQEWNYRERAGGERVYDRNIKRSPTERFRLMTGMTLDASSHLTEKQKEWFENHIPKIPSYLDLSAITLVLGYACLDPNHVISVDRFRVSEKILKKNPMWTRSFHISAIDILRYARLWERWFTEDIFE